MEDSFIEQRLAAATAVPRSQRTPEVAAFIECCQLQRELAEEQQQVRHPTRQQEALTALKLTRSHFLSPAVSLWYRPEVYKAAWARLRSASQIPEPANVCCCGQESHGARHWWL